MKKIETPEGHHFKGYYAPGFGLMSMYLIQERKFWFGKKVAFAMTFLDHHYSGVEAVNYLKSETLKNWKAKRAFAEMEREVRNSL